MFNEICVAVENARNSKLLSLFNALEEFDKDIVISMSELLVEKSRNNITDIVSINVEKLNNE